MLHNFHIEWGNTKRKGKTEKRKQSMEVLLSNNHMTNDVSSLLLLLVVALHYALLTSHWYN